MMGGRGWGGVVNGITNDVARKDLTLSALDGAYAEREQQKSLVYISIIRYLRKCLKR